MTDKSDRIIEDARKTEALLREIGEHVHADRINRLLRSRIQARTENQRIHRAIRELPEHLKLEILRR